LFFAVLVFSCCGKNKHRKKSPIKSGKKKIKRPLGQGRRGNKGKGGTKDSL
jgi:hypothetical protein